MNVRRLVTATLAVATLAGGIAAQSSAPRTADYQQAAPAVAGLGGGFNTTPPDAAPAVAGLGGGFNTTSPDAAPAVAGLGGGFGSVVAPEKAKV